MGIFVLVHVGKEGITVSRYDSEGRLAREEKVAKDVVELSQARFVRVSKYVFSDGALIVMEGEP